jgi:hypothetical protein
MRLISRSSSSCRWVAFLHRCSKLVRTSYAAWPSILQCQSCHGSLGPPPSAPSCYTRFSVNFLQFPFFHQSNYIQHQHTCRTSQELALTSAEWDMGQPKSCRHVEHCCSWSCESTKAKTHRKALVAKITLMLILKTRKEKVGGCVPSPPCKIKATDERGKLPPVAWSICVHYHHLLMMGI